MTLYDPAMQVPVTFELHEVLALGVLYENAPDDLDLTSDGVWFGISVDLAMLRLAESVSSVTGNKEALLNAGAVRARLEQARAEGA